MRTDLGNAANEEVPRSSPLIPRSFGYQSLLVWQKGMRLCQEVYTVTRDLPETERFGLMSQLRRAAVSVPSNIAEGHSRMSTGDYRHHVQMARGSVAEVETQLLLCIQLGLLTPDSVEAPMVLCAEISKMTSTLINKLR